MEKTKGYNRNLRYGKRPHRGIQKYGKFKTLTERFMAETKALNEYLDRTGIKPKSQFIGGKL